MKWKYEELRTHLYTYIHGILVGSSILVLKCYMLSKLIAESSNKWQPAVLVRDSVKQEASTPESVPPIDLRLQEYSPVQAVG